MQPASRCRSAGTDDELAGRSYRDRYPAVVGLLDFSDRPAAVDHHPVDDAHPVVAGPVSIPLFSVCSFASPTNISSPGKNAFQGREVPAPSKGGRVQTARTSDR